jgi:hypothetical protein
LGPLKDVTLGDNYANISKSHGIIDYTSNAQAGASISEIMNFGYTTIVNYIAFGSYLLFGLVISIVVFLNWSQFKLTNLLPLRLQLR